jgi:2-phospho-L-lactate guanylyltransferase
MILVPVKKLAHAKQRLASILDQPARTKLAQAMLLDVLETLAFWPNHPPVALITSDPYARELALRFKFEIIPDKNNKSETDAIEMATKVCEARGDASTLVIPGDIPLIQTAELERILDTAPTEGTVLVPSADRRGTNAAFRRPAGLIPLRFGNDSFRPHLEAARRSHKPCVVLTLPGIALDVDSPADLKQLAQAPGETRSQQLARQFDLRDLPRAANE